MRRCVIGGYRQIDQHEGLLHLDKLVFTVPMQQQKANRKVLGHEFDKNWTLKYFLPEVLEMRIHVRV